MNGKVETMKEKKTKVYRLIGNTGSMDGTMIEVVDTLPRWLKKAINRGHFSIVWVRYE